MSDQILEDYLSSLQFSLSKLQGEFVEICCKEEPAIDRAVSAVVLLDQATSAFESFAKTVKKRAAECLVPDPKDEVFLGGARVVHRVVVAKSLDKDAWATACENDPKLAVLEADAKTSGDKLKAAQKPYKLEARWIEIKPE